MTTGIRIRATRYWCIHRIVRVPYRVHHAYELEIVGHGRTMAPRKSKVNEWAMDYMACAYDNEPEDYYVEDVQWIRHQ